MKYKNEDNTSENTQVIHNKKAIMMLHIYSLTVNIFCALIWIYYFTLLA